MTLKIDGVDFSNFVELQGYQISFRKVTGQASGYLLDGSHNPDILAIKQDISLKFTASEGANTKKLVAALKKEVIALVFSDLVVDSTLDGTYEPSIGSIGLAIDKQNGGRYWYGFNVTFTER